MDLKQKVLLFYGVLIMYIIVFGLGMWGGYNLKHDKLCPVNDYIRWCNSELSQANMYLMRCKDQAGQDLIANAFNISNSFNTSILWEE